MAHPPPETFPVSLVIPVRNEAASLPMLLAGIRGQTFPPAEVIIVDGGSTDGTLDLARSLTADDARFTLIGQTSGTPGHNRNIGAEAAAHDWIAFTDAGTRADPEWLERLVEQASRDASVAVVYGNFEPVETRMFEQASALTYVSPGVEREGGRMRGPAVLSMMLRRHVWAGVGGFPDLRAAEDLIFMERIEKAGFRVAWAPRATVRWQTQPDLASTFRRFALYSNHNVQAGRQWDWHHGVARHYVFVVALLVLLAVLHSPWWWLGIPAWLCARIFLAIWRRRKGRKLLWLLNPARIVVVGAILITIDLATFAGWLQAAGGRRPG